MCKHVKMFSNIEKTVKLQNKMSHRSEYRLNKEDSMKCYKVLKYKAYEPGEYFCRFGEEGDRFFIILQGKVNVSVPFEIEEQFDNYWDVFNFVLEKHDDVRNYRDPLSGEISLVLKIIGVKLMRSLAFKEV